MDSTQRKKLRGLAHNLDPVVFVGQKGLTSDLITALKDALNAHELIKIKFVDLKDQKKEICTKLCEETDSHLAGIIGNIAIVYKQHPNPEKRKIEI